MSKPTERADEQVARQIVSTVLAVRVSRFEMEKANGQVDALIHYSDREAALEVVADHDAKLNSQQDALMRTEDRIDVSGLRESWTALLTRKATSTTSIGHFWDIEPAT